MLAFAIGSFLASRQASREGINPSAVFDLVFLVFVSGVVGARLFFVVMNLQYYLNSPLEIIMFQHGGLAWFGGLILGSVAAVLYLRIKRLPFYRTLDLLVPYVALAQAIGRVGCLLNGCCYGKESVFGFYFPLHQAVLMPTQLYSSLALIVIYVVLRIMQDHRHKAGQILCAYLGLYSAKRFIMEFFRADNPAVYHGLTLFQVLSAATFLFSLVFFIILNTRKK